MILLLGTVGTHSFGRKFSWKTVKNAHVKSSGFVVQNAQKVESVENRVTETTTLSNPNLKGACLQWQPK